MRLLLLPCSHFVSSGVPRRHPIACGLFNTPDRQVCLVAVLPSLVGAPRRLAEGGAWRSNPGLYWRKEYEQYFREYADDHVTAWYGKGAYVVFNYSINSLWFLSPHLKIVHIRLIIHWLIGCCHGIVFEWCIKILRNFQKVTKISKFETVCYDLFRMYFIYGIHVLQTHEFLHASGYFSRWCVFSNHFCCTNRGTNTNHPLLCRVDKNMSGW